VELDKLPADYRYLYPYPNLLIRFLAVSVFLPSSSSCFLTGSKVRFPFTSVRFALCPLFACCFNMTCFALCPFFCVLLQHDLVYITPFLCVLLQHGLVCITPVFLYFPPCLFLLNLDSTRLPGHRYLPMIVCVNSFHDFCLLFLSSVELPPVSLIQVQVVFQHPVINKLFAITVEGGPRK
jgi:hypothetical protein